MKHINDLEKVKAMLNKLDTHLVSEELEDILINMEHLVAQLLDGFEREIFEGRTLNDLSESNIL